MPIAAQVDIPALHLAFDGGAYVTTLIPMVDTRAQVAICLEALAAQPQEPSYSGSGRLWARVTVVPEADGHSALLTAGEVVLGRILVDPTVEILSGDGKDLDLEVH
jgi:hypothetical protein